MKRPKTTLSRFGDVGNYEPSNSWHTKMQQIAERRKKFLERDRLGEGIVTIQCESAVQSLIVEECSATDVRAFIEQNHYSKSIKGVTPSFCFKVTLDGHMVGAAIFGLPGMRETLEKYSEFGKYRLTELRRFCMVDETPRNSESKNISVMLRALKKYGVQRVLSYADPTYGHVGTIYKALGFTCLGQTASCSVIIYKDRQVKRSSLDRYPRYRYALRAKDQFRKWSTRVNRYANYQNKDLGLLPFAQEIRDALKTGKAYRQKEAGKFIYIKDLFPDRSYRQGRAVYVNADIIRAR